MSIKLKATVKVVDANHTHKFQGNDITSLGNMAKCIICHRTAKDLKVRIGNVIIK